MPTALESMFREFHEEVPVTRRVLERVPADKLSWKPHPTSMPLGHLAMHVAKIPGFFAKVVQAAELDMAKVSVPPPECPTNPSEILVALDQSISGADCSLLPDVGSSCARHLWWQRRRESAGIVGTAGQCR